MGDTKRVHIVKRWIDILALSLVVFLIYLAIEPQLGKLSNWFKQFVLKDEIFVSCLFLLASITAIWLLLWRFGATQFSLLDNFYLKNFILWPPVWLSVILALCYLSFLPNYTFVEIILISGIFLAGLFIGFVLCNVTRSLAKEKKTSDPKTK
ncbi:MAG: hypothetical protein JW749_05260 [Sedimentisphaerales bacterium]|nr:hypothetical protein [Sedimentisphaerales bacterium]